MPGLVIIACIVWFYMKAEKVTDRQAMLLISR
jgi:hypothetical protein